MALGIRYDALDGIKMFFLWTAYHSGRWCHFYMICGGEEVTYPKCRGGMFSVRDMFGINDHHMTRDPERGDDNALIILR